MSYLSRRIAARWLASQPGAEVSGGMNQGVEKSFSVHGTVTVMVTVQDEWLDADGDVLPQYQEQVRKLAHQKLGELMRQVPNSFNLQTEDM